MHSRLAQKKKKEDSLLKHAKKALTVFHFEKMLPNKGCHTCESQVSRTRRTYFVLGGT